MPYDAFLSYSHAADGKLAPALQSGLHRFAKPWYRLRALHVFRDETNLAVNPGLWTSIERALADSAYFLVLASPQGAESKWVRRELDYWLANKAADHLLIVMTGGDIVWDPSARDLDWQRTTALPPTMKGKLREEPLYLDLRWARTAEHLSLRHPGFRDAIASLAAPLRGVDKDTLIGEDIRQQRRTRRITQAAVITLVGLATAASLSGYFWFEQRNEARRQQATAEERLVRMDVANGSRLADEGDLSGSIVWFAEAASRGQGNPALNDMLRMRLAGSLRQHPNLSRVWFPDQPVSTNVETDGRHVVAYHEDGTAQVWDIDTGAARAPPIQRPDVRVMDVSFLQGGTRVITAGADGTARVWDAATGRDIASLVHDGEVNVAAFSPDGTRIVTASADRTARVWDIASGRSIVSLPHDDAVLDARFSRQGNRVLTLAADQTVRVWNVETGTALTLDLKGPLAQLEISPDGTRVLAISEDRAAHLLSATTGEVVSSLGDWAWVDQAQFSPDGRWVSMATRSGWVRMWDVRADTEGQAVHLKGLPISTAFSADSKRLVTAGNDDTAQVWDVETGQAVSPPLWHDDVVHEALLTPDGRRAVTVTAGGVVRVWELDAAGVPTLKHDDPVNYAVFSADGKRVLTVTDWAAEVWTVTPPATTLGAPVILKTGAQVYHAAWSPDGNRVVTATEEPVARVWDAGTGQMLMGLAHKRRVNYATFSRDGKRLATASENSVSIWDVGTGQKLASLDSDDPYPMIFVEFDNAGKRVLGIAFGHTMRVWDEAGKVIPALQHADVEVASFSPDGSRFATAGSDATLQVWNAATGAAVGPPIKGTYRTSYLAFSGDGSRFVATDGDTARVWDASTGSAVTRPLQHKSQVMHAAFSPDGTRVLTASTDGTARVWDATTGEPTSPPLRHDGVVRCAEFSSDGRRVVTASEDKSARIWDISLIDRPLPELIELAQVLAARHVDETGALVPLTSESFHGTWRRLHPEGVQ